MIKSKLSFVVYVITMLLFSAVACKKQDDGIGTPENYILTENSISDDCAFFQMRFTKGEYILKYSLSGPCKNLKEEEYLKNYTVYMANNCNNLKNKRGYIIIDHYEVSDIVFFQRQIIQITKKRLGSSVSLTESGENSFTMMLSNN